MISKEDRDKILEFCKEKQWRTYLHEVYLIDGLALEDTINALTAKDEPKWKTGTVDEFFEDITAED